MRQQIVRDGKRVDGRSLDEVRPISAAVGGLPKRVHGSGLFQRGLTQVLSTATLGTPSDAQEMDDLNPNTEKNYLHHYNFPPYSVGETRPMRSPGRREIGHGLLAEHGPQQWPFPAGTAPGGGWPRLYGPGEAAFPGAGGRRFPSADGRARLHADAPLGLAEPPCPTWPLVLTTGRYLGHWHTLTRTAQVERLRRAHPGPRLEVNPADLPAGLADGDPVRLVSRRGEVLVPLQLSEGIRPGTVFLPMHWGSAQPEACEANRLMHELGCQISGQPELKAAAVRLEPLA